MNDFEVLMAHLPDSVKSAITNYQMHKVASVITGLDANDMSFDKIAAFLGGRMAARNARWRPVAEGLTALALLGK